MAIEQARAYLKKYGVEDRIMEFSQSSATVELAAMAVGCEAGEIAKSLTFMVENGPIMIVVAGDAKISNSKYKAEFGKKAKMLTPDEVLSFIGHAVGGVCPFGIKEGVSVYLDKTLKKHDKVYPACGSSNSAIGLTIDELEQISGAIKWVDVCNE